MDAAGPRMFRGCWDVRRKIVTRALIAVGAGGVLGLGEASPVRAVV